MLRLTGQTRAVAGLDRVHHIGWDMTAALALGAALGVDQRLLAEWLPGIEAVAMAKINEDQG